MRVLQINQPQNNFTGVNQQRLIPTLQRNLAIDMKALTRTIMEKGELTAGKTQDIYSFTNSQGARLEIIINKVKQLIAGFKSYIDERCAEEATYDYNKKGDIIRIYKTSQSSSGSISSLRGNVKYTEDGLILTKNFSDGSKSTTTFSKNPQNRISFEKQHATTGMTEKLEYVEAETLNSKILKNGNVEFEAYGDAESGEMVFSRNNTKNYEEFIELMSNGKYCKQTCISLHKVLTNIVRPSVANHFVHIYKDLVTPQNELALKVNEFLA